MTAVGVHSLASLRIQFLSCIMCARISFHFCFLSSINPSFLHCFSFVVSLHGRSFAFCSVTPSLSVSLLLVLCPIPRLQRAQSGHSHLPRICLLLALPATVSHTPLAFTRIAFCISLKILTNLQSCITLTPLHWLLYFTRFSLFISKFSNCPLVHTHRFRAAREHSDVCYCTEWVQKAIERNKNWRRRATTDTTEMDGRAGRQAGRESEAKARGKHTTRTEKKTKSACNFERCQVVNGATDSNNTTAKQ